jgi:hypothetical protein
VFPVLHNKYNTYIYGLLYNIGMNNKMSKKIENTKLTVASFITGHPKAVMYGVGFAVTLAVLPFLVQVHEANAYWHWRWHGPFITLHRHITFLWLLPPGYGSAGLQLPPPSVANNAGEQGQTDQSSNPTYCGVIKVVPCSAPYAQGENNLAANLAQQDFANDMGIWNHYNP